MRGLVFLVVVVAAGAVNLAHVAESKETRSPFAAAVLAELNTHLEAGGPADELKTILADIRARIDAADATDKAGWGERKSDCDEEVAKLGTAWNTANNTLTSNLAKQAQQQGIIQEQTIAEAAYASERDAKKAEMDATEVDLEEAADKRAYGAEVYGNRTDDTDECIAAVEEILSLEGNKMLSKNQGMTADTVEANYDYTKGSTDINTVAVSNQTLLMLASKVHSAGAKELMSRTAQGYDYDDLKELLDRLLVELNKYKVELKTVEDQAISDYAEEKAALEEQLVTQTAARDTAEANRKAAEEAVTTAEGKLAELKIAEEKIRKELSDLEGAIDTWKTTCSDQEAEYNQRKQDRIEERATLSKIEKIVDEKLGHLMDDFDGRSKSEDDVHERVADVTNE